MQNRMDNEHEWIGMIPEFRVANLNRRCYDPEVVQADNEEYGIVSFSQEPDSGDAHHTHESRVGPMPSICGETSLEMRTFSIQSEAGNDPPPQRCAAAAARRWCLQMRAVVAYYPVPAAELRRAGGSHVLLGQGDRRRQWQRRLVPGLRSGSRQTAAPPSASGRPHTNSVSPSSAFKEYTTNSGYNSGRASSRSSSAALTSAMVRSIAVGAAHIHTSVGGNVLGSTPQEPRSRAKQSPRPFWRHLWQTYPCARPASYIRRFSQAIGFACNCRVLSAGLPPSPPGQQRAL
jgi:hypothetical protein